MKNYVINLQKANYLKHFLFNLIVFSICYKLFGFEWAIIIGLADITRDLGMIVYKLYEKEVNMAKKCIWWIGDKTGSIGAWSSKVKAQQAIDEGLKSGLLNPEKTWDIIKHEVELCPTCGHPAEKDIIEGLGECLRCDHVRGDF